MDLIALHYLEVFFQLVEIPLEDAELGSGSTGLIVDGKERPEHLPIAFHKSGCLVDAEVVFVVVGIMSLQVLALKL